MIYTKKFLPNAPGSGLYIPAGFEQINEDLFTRKDSKFMAFDRPV